MAEAENGTSPSGAADRKPRLIVFDMDYTLWPFHVDTHPNPPLQKDKDGKIRDRSKSVFEPFPEVPQLLSNLMEQGYTMAVVSRTDAPPVGKQMLTLLDWNKYFQYQEIYPGRKTTHFKKIAKESGIEYTEMLFFDDEYRNIHDISAIGVTCVYVEEPMTESLLKRGLQMFAKRITRK